MTGVRLFTVVVLLLATISKLQCIPIEVVYTGEGCDCPKPLNYVVNVPPPPKEKTYTTSEHGYKLEVPMQAKAKVTYTFDFTVQEPKTPSPVEQEKWDLVAKIDRITAHKKDCIASEDSSKSCSCNRCSASRRYVSSEPARSFACPRFHPNSLSKTQRPTATIRWAAILQPIAGKSPLDEAAMLKSRHRRDISRIFWPKSKNQSKKQPVKQYNRSLRQPQRQSNRPLFGNFDASLQAPFKQLKNFLQLPGFRSKRDIKGEYDLIEKERDQMDLTLPEIIQFMPETLDPNFKRGQCQFGCMQQAVVEEAKRPSEQDSGNTLASVDKEVNSQTDDSSAADESKLNDISASHTKRNAADFGYSYVPANQPSYNPHAASHSCYSAQPAYNHQPIVANIPDTLPRPFAVTQSQYAADPLPQHYIGSPLPYQGPASASSARAMDAPPYGERPYPQPGYNDYQQLDRVIADIIHRHSDFIEAGAHGSKAEQEEHNKSLWKTLLGGKWQRFQTLDDYNGPPNPLPLYRK